MNPILSELLRTKAHIGKSRWNRELAEYIVGFRHDSLDTRKGQGSMYALFDLEKTSAALAQVLSFLTRCTRTGSPHILLVTQLPDTQFETQEQELPFDLSIIRDKWIGGMLTNWGHISESIVLYSQFRAYAQTRETLHFPVYQKYHKRFQGIHQTSTPRLPDVVIVTHPAHYEIALLEAKHLQIPVIAFVDTDVDPKILRQIDYIIPGNTQSPEFLLFCLNLFFTQRHTHHRA